MKTSSKPSVKLLLLALFAMVSVSLTAQVTVTGTVYDNTGETVIGGSVVEKGQTGGVTTDIDGNFTIKVKNADATLVISYIGLQTKEVALKGRTHVDVTLDATSEALEELVVVGYGTQKRSDITGSVASLSEDQMRQTIVTNADQMLQGKVAGVQVTQNSGAPGGATSIRIRGASSLNSSNEPLYIVDGVPMSTAGSDIGGFDWMGGSNGQTKVNPLASIAPSDIVSIDVLKDASACAIYGAAGANGVVMVTTRRGSAGHTNITYDGYVAWQQAAKRLDMMDMREYARYQTQLFNEGVIVGTQYDPMYSDPSILGKGTDWQDEVFRTAMMQSHQVGVSGGNDKTTYAMSAGWMKQDGIIIGSDFQRFNTRFNIDNNFTKWLKVGGSLAYTRTDETITRNDGNDGVIMSAMTMQPTVPVKDFNGNWAGMEVGTGSAWNPVALALITNNTMLRQKIMGSFYASVDFLKYFNLRAEYAFDASQSQNKSFLPTYKFGTKENNVNMMRQQEDHSWFWMQKDYVTYHQVFGGKHDVNVMAGFEASKSSWNGTWIIKQNFSNDYIHILGEDGEFVKNSGWSDSVTNASFFARVNYGFDNRYLLTATVRRDGSSKFGANNKWGTFPAVALAWRINQEKWFEDVTWLNNLKLRLGYGQVGNSNIDTYRYGSAMSSIATSVGTIYYPQNLANPELKWEASEQWNAGIDLGVLDNRLSVTLDVYKKSTKDLLMQMFVPGHIGPSTDVWASIAPPYANIGKTENKGIDIQINAIPVTNKAFHWSSALTFSLNRNKVVALNDESAVLYQSVGWNNFDNCTMLRAGDPMGVFVGYETDGLFQNEADILGHATQYGSDKPYSNKIGKVDGIWIGDIKFKDQNGDGIINDKDRVVIGDPNPDFTFGWTNTLNYKDFELNIGLQGQVGGDILNWARYMTSDLSSIWNNQLADVLDRAQVVKIDPAGGDDISNLQLAPGSNGIPRFSNLDLNKNRICSDRWIEDASYLRIQNISLAYNLPEKWAKKAFLNTAKIYFNVQNVYTFTKYKGYDPEIGSFNQSVLMQNIDQGRYPTPRTYTIGLNLSF